MLLSSDVIGLVVASVVAVAGGVVMAVYIREKWKGRAGGTTTFVQLQQFDDDDPSQAVTGSDHDSAGLDGDVEQGGSNADVDANRVVPPDSAFEIGSGDEAPASDSSDSELDVDVAVDASAGAAVDGGVGTASISEADASPHTSSDADGALDATGESVDSQTLTRPSERTESGADADQSSGVEAVEAAAAAT